MKIKLVILISVVIFNSACSFWYNNELWHCDINYENSTVTCDKADV